MYAKDIVTKYKNNHKCFICGEDDPCCLEFHHVLKKKFAISKTAHKKDMSCRVLKEELRKTCLVCSNCHKKLHSGSINISQKELLSHLVKI